jgi:hypothetical protein
MGPKCQDFDGERHVSQFVTVSDKRLNGRWKDKFRVPGAAKRHSQHRTIVKRRCRLLHQKVKNMKRLRFEYGGLLLAERGPQRRTRVRSLQ